MKRDEYCVKVRIVKGQLEGQDDRETWAIGCTPHENEYGIHMRLANTNSMPLFTFTWKEVCGKISPAVCILAVKVRINN